MAARAFRDGDLRLLLGLAQELWPDVRCSFGEIAFWSAQLPHSDWEARLWFEDSRLAAWGWSTRDGELAFEARPGDAALVPSILEWAQPTSVLAPPLDAAVLEAHGLRPDLQAPWFRWNVRSLAEVDEPRLPAGYRLTTMAEHTDFSSRSAAHRTAFSPSRFTDDVYAVVRRTWPYRPDLDCVAIAADGTVAAYALAWLDEENRLGELEPVGTHVDHRRGGLGRAVNLFALQRLREEGAETAIVGCRGDDAYPIPRLLYESVGFREAWRKVAFQRA